jgi:hypothetical protein
MVNALSEATGMAPETLLDQDWDSAASHARSLIEHRSDLAWPFAVVGWAAERSGNIDAAIAEYVAGLRALGSTSAFTDDWWLAEHWHGEKFAAARLVALERSLPPAIRTDPHVSAILDRRHKANDRFALKDYWLSQADEALRRGNGIEAYQCTYRAGWDAFSCDWMPEILDRLAAAARAAGSRAWERLAQHHRESLSS